MTVSKEGYQCSFIKFAERFLEKDIYSNFIIYEETQLQDRF
jgi:hypothetical protein